MNTKISIIALTFMILINTGKAQNIGEPAPDFNLSVLGGGSVQLSDYLGNTVFIFFVKYN